MEGGDGGSPQPVTPAPAVDHLPSHSCATLHAVGEVASIRVVPPTTAGGGLLVLHRSRCCTLWCRRPGTPPGDPCRAPQPDAPVLLVQSGKVVRRYLAGRVYDPHSVVLSGDGRSFLCIDRRAALVARVELATGAELASYGAPWAAAAMASGAPEGALPALHRRARAALGPGALSAPAGAADAADGRVFVGAGYADGRVVVFNASSGEVLAEVLRAPPPSLGAAAALAAAGAAGDPTAPAHAAVNLVPPGAWHDMCGAAAAGSGSSGGLCDAAVAAWAARAAAGPADPEGGLSLAGAIAAGADPGEGAPPRPPSAAAGASGPAQGGPAAAAQTHTLFADPREWGWQLPHALLVDGARRRLYVANRQRPAVEVLHLDTYAHICSYALRAAIGGDAMVMALALEPSSGRLFAGVDSNTAAGAGAVVELNPTVCGEAMAVYPAVAGSFPRHDLDVAARAGGGLTFYVASHPPQAWALPPVRAAAAGASSTPRGGRTAARVVGGMLEAQVASLLVLALLTPAAYVLLLAGRAAARGCCCGTVRLGWTGRQPPGVHGRSAARRYKSAPSNDALEPADNANGSHVELAVTAGSFTQASRRHLPGQHLPGIAEGAVSRGFEDHAPGWWEEEGAEFDEEGDDASQLALLSVPSRRASSIAIRTPSGLAARAAGAGSFANGALGGGGSFIGRAASGSAGLAPCVSPFLALSARAESQLLIAALAGARSFSGPPAAPPLCAASTAAAGAPHHEVQRPDAPQQQPAAGEAPAGVGPVQQAGSVYFVRHGESTSNERGVLAGVVDVNLTRFGVLQARQAGRDVASKVGWRAGGLSTGAQLQQGRQPHRAAEDTSSLATTQARRSATMA
jgi:hypothetical protein